MSLRIVLTDTWSWPEVRRGGERYLHELASALGDSGHRVSILTTGPEASTEHIAGVQVRRVRRRAPLASRFGDAAPEVAFGVQALGRLASAAIDVWHATSIPDGAAAAALGSVRPGLRTVFTDHGFPVKSSRRQRADWRLQQLLARHIGAYICVSEAAGACLRSDYGRDPVVVPPGVDVRRFRPAPARHLRPAIVYSGSLVEPRKNVGLLLDAAALLAQRVPDLEVWLLGPGDPGALLAVHAQGAAAVSFAASVDDAELADRYGRAWVTVLPSHAESFGMVVLESWACGTPVVVLRDGGGPAEIVRDDLGVRTDATAEALREAIEAAFELAHESDTADRCREAAERFDWRRAVVPRLEQVYAGSG